MRTKPWKELLPVFAAIALFYSLSLLYFSPVLEGKRLVQSDIKQWQGMAHEVDEHRERTGEEALWTGSMFSGMPAYQISVKWSSNLLLDVHQVFSGFLPRPASFLFLYLVGMFILLRILRVDPWTSLLGAVAFAFSTYFLILLPTGHTSKANAIGYMPMVLGGAYLLYRGKMLLGAALLALFLGLEIAMNHLQVTYYLGMVLLLFVLAELLRAFRANAVVDFMKRSGLGLLALLFAIGCNLGSLWSTYEYGQYSTRGPSELTIRADGSSAADVRTDGLDKDYVTDYSFGVQETFNLLVPNAKGGSTGTIGNDPSLLLNADPRYRQNVAQMNRYWGDQRFVAGPMYLGAISILLMILLLAQAEGPARWWVLGVIPFLLVMLQITSPVAAALVLLAYLSAGLVLWKDPLGYALFSSLLLSVLLTWGSNYMPLTDFFLDHFPGYNKFRAVTIILVIAAMAVPVLGVQFIDRIMKSGRWDKATEKRSLVGIGALLLLLLAMALVPDGLFDFISTQEREAFGAQMDEAPGSEAQYLAFIDSLKQVRIGLFTADVWRSLAFVLGASMLILLFGRRKVGPAVLLTGLGLLIMADEWVVAKRFVNNEMERGRYTMWEDTKAHEIPYRANAADLGILDDAWFPEVEADYQEQLLKAKKAKEGASGRDRMVSAEEDEMLRFASLRRKEHMRVLTLGNPFNDARVSWFHRSVGGYHGAKLKRYQELIEFHLTPAISRIGKQLQSGTSMAGLDSMLAKEGVLNMLDTRWLVYDPDRPAIQNVNGLGAAWFVDEVQWAKDADEEIMQLGRIEPRSTALIDERYRPLLDGIDLESDASASVEMTRYETNEITYTVRSSKGGVVVFSEIWYGPDWKATVDGVPSPHFRADYVLRAMAVPAGEHTVVFKIVSEAYNTSGPIALASSGLLILLVLFLLGRDMLRTASTGRDEENA